jgi:two-component system, cell cycle sensor histidine kinase and response regulator CckA
LFAALRDACEATALLAGTAMPNSSRPRVLIIDDEPAILAVYPEVLGVDYQVTVASSGQRALELIASDPNFDVILCDYMMPDLDGRALYEHLSENAPQLIERLVFCSGGLVSERARRFVASVSNQLLEKPISIDRLIATIDAVVKRQLPDTENGQ